MVETKPTQSIWKEDASSPLIDRETNKRVRVDEKDVNKLIVEGKVGYAKDHRVNVVDKNGEVWTITGNYVRDALSRGYRLETAKEAGVREYVKENKGVKGALKVALGQFVDEALFGIPEQIYDKVGTEYDVAKKNALKEEHELVNAISGAGGFFTSMFYGGEVTGAAKAGAAVERALMGSSNKVLAGRLAEAGVTNAPKVTASLRRKVAASATKMGVESTLLAAPNAITEAALGDPEKAAEHLFIAFAPGFILGGTGKAIGAAGKAIGAVVGPKLSGLAEKQAVRSLFYESDEALERLVERLPGGEDGLGRRLLDDKLLRKVGENYEGLHKRIATKRSQTGEAIGDIYRQLDKAESKIKLSTTDELADRMEKEIVGELKKFPGHEAEIAKVQAYIDSFRKTGEGRSLSFTELHSWRQALDDRIYNEAKFGVQNPVGEQLEKARNIMNNELMLKGEKVARSHGGSVIFELRDLNLRYRQYKTAEKVAEKSSIVERRSRNFSVTDYGVGIGGAVGAIASGNPLPLVKGLAFATGHKFMREYGNSLVARAADRIGFSAKGQKLLKYGLEVGSDKSGILMTEKAMQEGAKELDKIPSILDRLSFKKAAKNVIVRGPSKLYEQLDLAEQTAALLQHPEELEQNIEVMTSIIRDQGAPQIGIAFANKQRTAAQYLLNEMPKQPLPDPFKPYQPEISKTELARYARKVEIVQNPYAILQHLEDGTMTVEHVEALMAVYPSLGNEMLARIDAYAYSGKMQPLAYRAQQNIALMRNGGKGKNGAAASAVRGVSTPSFVGKPSAGSLKNLPQLQPSRIDRVIHHGVGGK